MTHFTNNGCLAYPPVSNRLLALFSAGDSFKSESGKTIDSYWFESAYKESPYWFGSLLLYVRDIRGGLGCRELYRSGLKWLLFDCDDLKLDLLCRLLVKTPEVGRWDDLLCVLGVRDDIDNLVAKLIAEALMAGNKLCAKWMPRKGIEAVMLTKLFEISPKQYRKLLTGNTDAVETKMCAGQWNTIDFDKITSRAKMVYFKAFDRHTKNWQVYLDQVAEGKLDAKVGTLTPHDVVVSAIINGKPDYYEKLWQEIPNFTNDKLVIPMVDLSGSMGDFRVRDSARSKAVSLGLAIAEKNAGPMSNLLIAFSSNPSFYILDQSLSLAKRATVFSRSCNALSTNIKAAFMLLLNKCIELKLPQEEIPSMLAILSDMQFDGSGDNNTAVQFAKNKFEEAGYKCPVLVFWNIQGNPKTAPVTDNHRNCILVSGDQPYILTSVINSMDENGTITPLSNMFKTIGVPRYELFTKEKQ